MPRFEMAGAYFFQRNITARFTYYALENDDETTMTKEELCIW